MELRSTSGQQTVVEGVHPEIKLRIQWHQWSEPRTWGIVEPFTMWREITAALAPLGWKPTRTFTATDFKAKPQRRATGTAGQAQFDVSGITDAEWKHLDRWFRELVTNRVTVESARAVTAGQGGDWFRDNFLPGGLLGRHPGYNVDGWVEWAADIASQAGRDVEHAKRSVRNALTTIEITTHNLGLRELENYRKRFAGTVSDEEAIAVVNAAPPNAITEAQKWAQDRLNTFLQKSASDYWFVKLHIALDGGPKPCRASNTLRKSRDHWPRWSARARWTAKALSVRTWLLRANAVRKRQRKATPARGTSSGPSARFAARSIMTPSPRRRIQPRQAAPGAQ